MKWSARDLGLAVAASALILDQATKLLMLYGVGLFYSGPGSTSPYCLFLIS